MIGIRHIEQNLTANGDLGRDVVVMCRTDATERFPNLRI